MRIDGVWPAVLPEVSIRGRFIGFFNVFPDSRGDFMLVPFIAAAACGLAVAADTHRAEIAPGAVQIISDTEIIIDGVTYHSWDEVAQSGFYQNIGTRCRTQPSLQQVDLRGSAFDCSFTRTNVEPQYEPSNGLIRIPVVVHVIQNTSGTGFISASRVQSQIDVLNEDFRAIAGTNGANGNDAQIEFFLATEDPDGNPTNGITYSTNNTWFNDNGAYYNSLAWDTNRYLNIYTNSASGALGYVPDLPQGGIVGSNADRVVILYSTFGRNAPFVPFHLGRTTTHEVGHYLGLFHTFDGGCGSTSSCSTTGDLICDTNPESSPTFGCPGSRTSCGLPAPFDNYMDYSDDICMEQFTNDQNNRMRCTIEHYRPNLPQAGNTSCNAADIAEPFGVLDLGDVGAFVAAFTAQDPAADIAPPSGVFDLADLQAFVAAFTAGCP
ncbi:MAG TPA: zinc metalloprotease [Phycisphaerales bacterium]|nr:zinc metalloprotease [Phycisphaerales bacterium]